jgi:hypothetical protein
VRLDVARDRAADFFFLAMAYQRLGDSARADYLFAKAVNSIERPAVPPPAIQEALQTFGAEAEEVLGKVKRD